MSLTIARFLTLALWLSMSTSAVMAKNDPLHDYLMQQSSEHLGEALGNVAGFVGLISAVQLRPEILQQEIAICGNCPHRKRLEAELARAKADKAALGQIGLTVLDIARATGLQTNASPLDEWRLGRKSIPDDLANRSPLCKALWVQSMECQAAELDENKRASVCWDHGKLSTLACRGDMTGLASYVAIMKSRAEGRLTFEPSDRPHAHPRQGKYWNLRKASDIAMPPDVGLNGNFNLRVDDAKVGFLHVVQVSRQMGHHDGWSFSKYPNPALRAGLKEDYIALQTAAPDARVLACRYHHNDGSYQERSFWFMSKPPMVTPALNERIPNHPLLEIGPVLSQCPWTLEEANALCQTGCRL